MDMNGIDIGFDLNVLRVFEALHEEGSATRAALRLGVTQSAVSAALARLRQAWPDTLYRTRIYFTQQLSLVIG